jgi:hypothetical protein
MKSVVIGWSSAARHSRTAKLGADMHVQIGHDGWHGRYRIASHGMSPDDVAVELQRFEAHHATWVERLTEMHAHHNIDFDIAGQTYRIVDFTMPSCQPGTRCRVVISARMVQDDDLVRVPGMPLTLWFNSLTAVPSADDLVASLRSALTERATIADAHEQFVGRVMQRLRAER